MPSTNELPQSTGDPLEPVAQLVQWLAHSTVTAVLGLTIGMVGARFLRHRHLHWSWAAAGLGIVFLARPLLGSSTATCTVAAVAAAVWGRRWHTHDTVSGGDLGELAADRRSPLDALRTINRLAVGPRALAESEESWRDGEIVLGCDERSRPISVPTGGWAGGVHTLVVGATGSGKTVTQTWIAVRMIERGMGTILLDPKGDRGMREGVCRAARAAGRRFVEWTPDGSSVYNPYARGSETQIADRVLAGERFTEPHYLRQAQRYMGHVVRALRRCGREVSLHSIVEHLDPPRLERLVRELPQSEAQPAHDYLDSMTSRQQGDLAGVRDRLAILTESDVGRWLDPCTRDSEQFDLVEAVRARSVVYFNLESDSRPLLAQMLAAAIVQDLQATAASLQGRPVPTLVVIDEFSAVAPEQIVRLFGRARSAGLSLLLGTQELSDLRLPTRHDLLEQVMGNLSTVIAHRQVVPRSAELIASLAGSRGAWRTSQRSDGASTRTRTRVGVLQADDVMRLQRGWAAVLALSGGSRARVVRVFTP